jgi:hypothetical protein
MGGHGGGHGGGGGRRGGFRGGGWGGWYGPAYPICDPFYEDCYVPYPPMMVAGNGVYSGLVKPRKLKRPPRIFTGATQVDGIDTMRAGATIAIPAVFGAVLWGLKGALLGGGLGLAVVFLLTKVAGEQFGDPLSQTGRGIESEDED